MGGDLAPGMVIKGANIARQRFPQARFLIFGNEGRIKPLMKKLPHLAKVSSIHHTDIAVKSEDKPSAAARRARGSSMHLACEAVQSGEAAGVVSAGNTGALLAIAMLMLRTLPGIHRRRRALPTRARRGVSDPRQRGMRADNLVQFAIMGNVFARTALGVLQPTVGIQCRSKLKGRGARAAAALRSRRCPAVPQRGGDDIAKGTVDVIVTDGFTGNVALKTIEGTAKLYTGFLRESFRTSIMAKVGYLLARPAINSLRTRVDPRRYNGAIFLGLNGIALKSHGGTDAIGFANAIGVAVDMVVHGAIEKIKEDFAHLTTPPLPDVKAASL